MTTLSESRKRQLKRVGSVIPPSWRQGVDYWSWRRFLLKAERWTRENIDLWQIEHIRGIVRWAYESTQGYRELYDKASISPDDIRTLKDVAHIPFTTKELLRDNLEAFSVESHSRRYITTGGSTGIPFGFFESDRNRRIETAFIHASWSRTGWKLGARSAVLRGSYIGTEETPIEYDPFHRELKLSSYFLTSATISKYIAALKDFKISFLQAYPSTLNLFCDLILEKGLVDELPLRVILLGSENIYDWQLQKLAQIFPQVKVFGWYGHAEKAALAPWCENSRTYHAWPYYGHLEILDSLGKGVELGEEGELVCTAFHQRITPFIRYRTMDRGVNGGNRCSSCGRNFQILSQVLGRSHEVIVTGTGRYISMTAINMHDDIFDSLRQFQFYQDTVGRVVFKFVPKANVLSQSNKERICAGLRAKLGNDMDLILESVTSIPRTKAGKYCFLEQKLTIAHGDR